MQQIGPLACESDPGPLPLQPPRSIWSVRRSLHRLRDDWADRNVVPVAFMSGCRVIGWRLATAAAREQASRAQKALFERPVHVVGSANRVEFTSHRGPRAPTSQNLIAIDYWSATQRPCCTDRPRHGFNLSLPDLRQLELTPDAQAQACGSGQKWRWRLRSRDAHLFASAAHPRSLV